MRLLITAAFAAALYLLLCYMTSRSVFYPFRYPQGDWDARDRIGARDLSFTASDGVRLHAWWAPLAGARVATLHLHGNGGNLTHRWPLVPHLHAAGSSVLLLDYRGYGKSEGRPTERGLQLDAEAAYQELSRLGFRPGQIVIHGESLGSAIAVDLAARRPCAGVVLEAPFSSAKDVAARVLPVLGPFLIWGWDSTAKIGRVRAPKLFLHGDRDEIIDYSLGRKLFAAASDPKFFQTVPGARHNDLLTVTGAKYAVYLKDFYSRLAGPEE